MGDTLPLTAIVLAGGLSSRMGQDKALIQFEGVPLLRRTCQLALECVSEVVVVTSWPQRYRGLLPNRCTLVQETPLLKQDGEQPIPHGPLVGFAQGLIPVRTDWVLLLACDLPMLQVEVLQHWVKDVARAETAKDHKWINGQNSSSAAIAFLPRHAKGWEPLCGFYHRNCLADLTAFIAQGGRSFQAWLAQHPVEELRLPDKQMLFNCNTPHDLNVIKKNTALGR